MNIHELIRPSKRRWRKIRERRDFEFVRQGYNALKLPHTDENSAECDDIVRDLLELEFPQDSKIIDAGCGAGTLCRQLRAGGFCNVAAFDISDENVKAAMPFVTKAFRSSCEAIDEGDGIYDLALSITVIEHVMDAGKALGELNRILRPGGYLYITTDNSWWQTAMTLKRFVTPPSMWYHRFPQPIDGDFTTWELGGLLGEAGFGIRRIIGIGGIPIGNRVVENLLGGPTTRNPLFKHFTTRMAFLARKR